MTDVKWYYKPVWLLVAVLAVGPFALPLVWLSPCLKRLHKIIVTILIIAVTVWLAKTTIVIYRDLLRQIAELQSTMQ
ncbi:MAG: hypothetical protein WCY36_06520 [Candidatus Omnitrophota bacterium]